MREAEAACDILTESGKNGEINKNWGQKPAEVFIFSLD